MPDFLMLWSCSAVTAAVLLAAMIFFRGARRWLSVAFVVSLGVAGWSVWRESGTVAAGAMMLLALLLALAACACLAVKIRRLRQNLRNNEAERQNLETLINSVDGIVWECDAETLRFRFVSRKAARMLGYPPEQWTASPNFRAEMVHPDDRWVIAHCRNMGHLQRPYEFDYRVITKDGATIWLREAGFVSPGEPGAAAVMRGVLRDISRHREASVETERLQQSLMETSRHAGMAEVATSVLHNVGNLLNSVGVCATLASERAKTSKAGNLRRAVEMIRDQGDDLASFLAADPKGRLLPEYIGKIAEQIIAEQQEIASELDSLNENVNHIKEIVAMQQGLAKVTGVYEMLHPVDLADSALRMTADDIRLARIQVIKEYCILPPRVRVDRHKALQILVNLIRNAMQAMDGIAAENRILRIRIETVSGGEMVAIRIRDNGIGISPENLTEIFRHGFTTKQYGHGFGLHGAANFAREMAGSLVASSEGSGMGAEFTLTLPTSGGDSSDGDNQATAPGRA